MTILDDRWIEFAYVILVAVSGLWAYAQVRYAMAHGTLWRWITAYWLVSKWCFFLAAAFTWWANDMPEGLFTFALSNLVVAHVVAYLKWRTLPTGDVLPRDPPDDPIRT